MSALSIIAPAAQVAGNLIQSSEQRRNDLAARKWQEQQVEKANQYNSPAAMIQRMREAGINPNLVTGQPISTSASVPQASQGSRAPNYDDIGTSVMAALNYAQQSKLNESQILQQKEQASLTHEQARALKAENDARENGYTHKSYVDVSSSTNPDEVETTEYENHFNYYEEKVKADIVGFITNRNMSWDNQYLSGINRVLKDHELTFSTERVEHAAEIIAGELQSIKDDHNVKNAQVNLLNQQINAMWVDVAQGLYAKNHIELDENGKPVNLKDEWITYYQTKEIVGDILNAFGQVADIFGSIYSSVSKTHRPRTSITTTSHSDEYGAFKGGSVTRTVTD